MRDTVEVKGTLRESVRLEQTSRWTVTGRSVVAEQRCGFPLGDDPSVGREHAKATDRVESELPLKDIASLRLGGTADSRPVRAGQARLLHFKLRHGFARFKNDSP